MSINKEELTEESMHNDEFVKLLTGNIGSAYYGMPFNDYMERCENAMIQDGFTTHDRFPLMDKKAVDRLLRSIIEIKENELLKKTRP